MQALNTQGNKQRHPAGTNNAILQYACWEAKSFSYGEEKLQLYCEFSG